MNSRETANQRALRTEEETERHEEGRERHETKATRHQPTGRAGQGAAEAAAREKGGKRREANMNRQQRDARSIEHLLGLSNRIGPLPWRTIVFRSSSVVISLRVYRRISSRC